MYLSGVENSHFKVCVVCMTYNHSRFIVETLDGFCLQKTNFPYVCIIVDDASTDGEKKVIENYLSSHFVASNQNYYQNKETDDYVFSFFKHNTNDNCWLAFFSLKYNHYLKKSKFTYICDLVNLSEYTALCEGDDYWTSQDKLQKQVDFLDQNPRYVLTCHRYSIYDQEEDFFEDDGNDSLFINEKGISFDVWTDHWLAKTLTIVYRTNANEEYLEYPGTRRDTNQVYFLLKKGLGFCFFEKMGVYRRSEVGVCGKKDRITNSRSKYLIYKELYDYEKNSYTKQMHYKYLLEYLIVSHGKAVFKIKYSFSDFLCLPYYSLKYLIKYVKYKTLVFKKNKIKFKTNVIE